jgi:hypothetical protein
MIKKATVSELILLSLVNYSAVPKKNTSRSEVVVLGRKRVQLLIQAYCNGLVNVFVLGLAGNWKN